MLRDSVVHANIPAADLDRARAWYADVLGLEPVRDLGEALWYTTSAGTSFSVYRTAYAGQAGHTIAQLHVRDLDAEVAALRAKGVELEVFDAPGLQWDDGVATLPGLGRAAWFRDSEGNTLCVDEPEDAALVPSR